MADENEFLLLLLIAFCVIVPGFVLCGLVLKRFLDLLNHDTPTHADEVETGYVVVAGLASFFIPGLGQLINREFFKGFVFFVGAFVLWLVLLGWIVQFLSVGDAIVSSLYYGRSPWVASTKGASRTAPEHRPEGVDDDYVVGPEEPSSRPSTGEDDSSDVDPAGLW